MKIVDRDGQILLTVEDVEFYLNAYDLINITQEYARTERDYFVLDMENLYNDVDRMSKWSLMSTIIHKIDKSVQYNAGY